jgi:ATP-dependent RNA helicase RhlE
MPPDISKLASGFLDNPVRIEVSPQSSTLDQITQQVMFVEKANKRHLMLHLLEKLSCTSSIVFTRTKHGANRLVTHLQKSGVQVAAIHGNKSQNARLRALAEFSSGKISVLVATDIASRGIDVEGISHVFNYDLPNIAESYVHRIGRTGRAGASGASISFCEEEEVPYLFDIERLIGKQIPDEVEHQWHSEGAFRSTIIARTHGIPRQQRKKSQKSNHGRNNNNNSYQKRRPQHRRKR